MKSQGRYLKLLPLLFDSSALRTAMSISHAHYCPGTGREQQWGEAKVLSPLPQPQRMNLMVLSGIHISFRDWI